MDLTCERSTNRTYLPPANLMGSKPALLCGPSNRPGSGAVTSSATGRQRESSPSGQADKRIIVYSAILLPVAIYATPPKSAAILRRLEELDELRRYLARHVGD